jgi:hypothetical protein
MEGQTLVTFSEPPAAIPVLELPTAEPADAAAAGPDPAAAVEFATRVLRGWHFVAELSVLGQAMCACGQPWEYCEYRLLARRCGLTDPSNA